VYWNLIGQRTDAQVCGYGIGGTKIAKHRVSSLKTHYMPDGLHPNDAGHILIGNCLLPALHML
jgi:lysophospholipase L1-like esterase